MFLSPALNKALLVKIREGDYQHPGEEEAIELVFRSVEKNLDSLWLDVGCGTGGTAAYLQSHKWGKIIGIDIDQEVLKVARKKYSSKDTLISYINCKNPRKPLLLNCNALESKNYFDQRCEKQLNFDLIYLFNSLFLFSDHVRVLKELRKQSHASTKLIIFDYIDYDEYDKNQYLEDSKPFLPNPIKLHSIETYLNQGGWILSSQDHIDDLYLKWYIDLFAKIEQRKNELNAWVGDTIVDLFSKRYEYIIKMLKKGILGGVILRAEPDLLGRSSV